MRLIIEKNLMVPMRDGVKLATDVYRPDVSEAVPTLVQRVPYNKEHTLVQNYIVDLLRTAQAGFAVVVQDCRGCSASEGEFTPFFQEGPDGADTIAWAASQPWSNGKVGTIGQSYYGVTQWQAALQSPQALLAMVPGITTADYYESWMYQGGAFQLGFILNWALGLGFGAQIRRLARGQITPQDSGELQQTMSTMSRTYAHLPLTDMPVLTEIAPYYLDWLAHTSSDDYWRPVAPQEGYERVTAPAFSIGGWFDLFLRGTLTNYQGMKQRGGSETARQHQRLLIGPWTHGYWGAIYAGQDYGLFASLEGIDGTGQQLRWFDHWLKGVENGVESDKSVRIFVMGANIWRDEDDWPLPDTQYRPYYLHSTGQANTASGNGTLSSHIPTTDEIEDVYRYNPHHPVPTMGGATLLPDYKVARNAGPLDQRPVEAREDVLVFSSPVLEKEVEVTGPVVLVLSVSSSAKDTDFTGTLVDVYPDGRAVLLTDGILRTRFRESFNHPVLMEPGKIYELRLDLGATSNVFQVGHRIRLDISSSNFPRYDRNTNTGGTIANETEKDFVEAINRVYHDAAHPSRLMLPIIERD
ncbi:MAG TPA: CocE/NonD family hydrolase [Ktedonobacteraceae bacterium]|jgi:putative CocE/NonD family hydrolase|nr:CocE/NonD family hydrolase [Ktedonobacteraceae bacterium]